MWQILFILVALAASECRIIENCNGVIVQNVNHEQEVIKTDLDSPYQLAIDYDSNTLFFSLSQTDSTDYFVSAYIHLKTNEYSQIKGISGGFANAVDSKTHKVYLGGSDGVYEFDFDTKLAKRVSIARHNVWQMFSKDILYYTTYPDETAYEYVNGKSKEVPELAGGQVLLVALDNNKNFYFSNSSGLFIHDRIDKEIRNLGNYTLNGITSDINGKIYFSTPSGIYFINENDKAEVTKLVALNDIYGVVIEGDGSIIYSTKTSLIRLKPTKDLCFEENKL